MIKVAVLDDYQNIFKEIIDINNFKNKYIFKIFNEPFANESEASIALEEFEALFVTQMLKQAYQSKLSDGIFDSSENETFQSMLNQELGRKFSTNSNFGIADALIMQFKSNPK